MVTSLTSSWIFYFIIIDDLFCFSDCCLGNVQKKVQQNGKKSGHDNTVCHDQLESFRKLVEKSRDSTNTKSSANWKTGGQQIAFFS